MVFYINKRMVRYTQHYEFNDSKGYKTVVDDKDEQKFYIIKCGKYEEVGRDEYGNYINDLHSVGLNPLNHYSDMFSLMDNLLNKHPLGYNCPMFNRPFLGYECPRHLLNGGESSKDKEEEIDTEKIDKIESLKRQIKEIQDQLNNI